MELILVCVAGIALVGTVAGASALARWFRSDARKTRQVRAALRALAPVPIGKARGRCHITGMARVMEPVPGYPTHGAFFARSVGSVGREVERDERTTWESVPTVSEVTRVGRFAVIDDSGVALVEDPDALVWYCDVSPFGAGGSGSIDVKDGTRVEVVGIAEPGILPPALAGHGGYRADGMAVTLRAPPRGRLLVVVDE
jgi:hypothetical protein